MVVTLGAGDVRRVGDSCWSRCDGGAAVVERDVPIARLTTIGTGGPAALLRPAGDDGQLRDLLRWRWRKASTMAVVGLGSNLLAADSGFDGLVLRLEGELAAIERDGDGQLRRRRVAGRGRETGDGAGLSGIEFGCAIPGTVGGAVRMNAGAYGGEMRDVLVEAVVLAGDGERSGGADELALRYRGSNVRPARSWRPRGCR